MYDAQIIGKSGYKAVQQVRRNIDWSGIARAYSVRKGFDAVARRLVARMLLSDDGKSMKVLYLDKLGAAFVVGYMKRNPDALYILNPPAVHGVILSFQFTHVMPVEAFRMEPLSVWAVPYSGQYGPLCRMQGDSV